MHRAIWGKDLIEWGKRALDRALSRRWAAEAGEWAKLEFDGGSVGLETGAKVKGFAFTVHGGTAYFDKMGVVGSSDPAPIRRYRSPRGKAQKGKDTPGAPGDINGWLKRDPRPTASRTSWRRCASITCSTFAPPRASRLRSCEGAGRSAKGARRLRTARCPRPSSSKICQSRATAFVMMRGQYDTPGEKVVPRTPAVLPPLKKAGERGNRLDLARWLVSRENPLTARVAVNRFWQQVFGVGLVESSHDFGTQGIAAEPPGAARLARGHVSGGGLGREEAHAPHDHDQRDLPPAELRAGRELAR